jgi:hypothetical protein
MVRGSTRRADGAVGRDDDSMTDVTTPVAVPVTIPVATSNE